MRNRGNSPRGSMRASRKRPKPSTARFTPQKYYHQPRRPAATPAQIQQIKNLQPTMKKISRDVHPISPRRQAKRVSYAITLLYIVCFLPHALMLLTKLFDNTNKFG
jgi:hypothetical protein